MPVDEAVFALEEHQPKDALLAVAAGELRRLLAEQETLLSLATRSAGEAPSAERREALAELKARQAGLAGRAAERIAAMRQAAAKRTTFAGSRASPSRRRPGQGRSRTRMSMARTFSAAVKVP